MAVTNDQLMEALDHARAQARKTNRSARVSINDLIDDFQPNPYCPDRYWISAYANSGVPTAEGTWHYFEIRLVDFAENKIHEVLFTKIPLDGDDVEISTIDLD